MVDKTYCMSSYLAFRYIEKEDVDFYEGMKHRNFHPISDEEKTPVWTEKDVDEAIQEVFDGLGGQRLGLMLSGGMDSASLASYMRGCDAYTFRFSGGGYSDELKRAEYYADYYQLRLHYVDITWKTVENYLDDVMRVKNAPVHSIEPQLMQAAVQAKTDGVERLIVGESADLIFGGMDGLLAKDWTVGEFMERYVFLNPADVLANPADISYLFERYRIENDRIDFLSFMDDVFSVESSGSYMNAFEAADMPYTDPYAGLKMAEALDLDRVRHGEPKYLVRGLFARKYLGCSIPDKVPMPRPVDIYFKDWRGPTRPEFKKRLGISRYTGNQKWQMYCLERFLNMYEPI